MKKDNSAHRVTQLLREQIAALPPGSRLPSVREQMSRLGVSPGTVQAAVAQLSVEGLIEARPGQGTFVAAKAPARAARDLSWQSIALGSGRASAKALTELVALPPPGVTPLSTGYLPEDLQPLAPLAAAMRRALGRPGVWDRMDIEGLTPLRAWFAQEAGGEVGGRDVMICPGSQAAIATAFRALAAPGAAIAMESPTFIGAMAAAAAAGLRVVPVPTDTEGVRPHLLAEVLAASGARLFYCQPTFANPSGTVLPTDRRSDILDVVRAAGAFLVEDDWARDLALEKEPPKPLMASDPDGHVVYIRSLTKPAAPGLRVGALCARGAAFARLKAARTSEDFFVAGPIQEATLQLVTSTAWRRHLRTIRMALRERRDALVAAVREHFGDEAVPLVPTGGLHLWMRLPDAVADEDLAARALRASVLVSPGGRWFPAEPTGSFLRLTFAGAPVDALRRSVATLAGIVPTSDEKEPSPSPTRSAVPATSRSGS
jgi:DNA-binding transcriptional MocR family regulator